MLVVPIMIGLAAGTFATHIMLKYGWKPALALTLALLGYANLVAWQTDLDIIDIAPGLVAYGAARFLFEPALKKRIELTT